MITSLRHLVVDSWVGRIIALLIFVAFIGWGANDVFLKPSYDDPNTLGSVGRSDVTLRAFDARTRLMSGRIEAAMGHKPGDVLSAQEKTVLRRTVLQSLLSDFTLRALARSYGMHVPDDVIRANVYTIPAFHDEKGHFDQARLRTWLRNVDLTEAAFVDEVRGEVINVALGASMARSLTAPHTLVSTFADYLTRIHNFNVLTIAPEQIGKNDVRPDDVALRRYYDNHPWAYQTSERRHARVILLTADTLKGTLEVPDAQVKTLYESRASQYNQPETRDFDYFIFKDEGAARAMVALWQKGASWADLKSRAGHAIADRLTGMSRDAIPSPELADAAFHAQVGAITAPIQSPAGWIVLKVAKITPEHHVDLAQARARLVDEIQTQEAMNKLSENVGKLQDAVAGDASLDHIPAALGGRPAEGTLTRDGKTDSGEDAPLPGTPAERGAILSEIFKQKVDAPPRFVALPDGGAFVVKVDRIEAQRQIPFEEARASVAATVLRQNLDRAENVLATRIFTEAKAKGGISKVQKTKIAGLALQSSRATTVQSATDTRDALSLAALDKKVGETGMLAVEGKYYVFTVTSIANDDGAAHAARKILQQRADVGLRQDAIETLRQGAAEKMGVHLNRPLIDRVLNGEGG